MRGASATAHILDRHPRWNVRVLVVWEPILPTDWEPPSRSDLGRISDPRVRQFWDPNHLISQSIRRRVARMHGSAAPNSSGGYYWDEVLVFAPHVRWRGSRSPAVWAGPVFMAAPRLASALRRMVSATPPARGGQAPPAQHATAKSAHRGSRG
ncbi:MAG: hypothetical protein ACRD2E_06595 [Terriglobales bacterium]